MIRLNVDEAKLQSGDLIDVVKQLFWYQIFWKDSFGADFVVKNENKIHNERSINKKISRNDCGRHPKS